MSEEVQVEGKETLSEVVSTPKRTKEAYLKARVDYETGNFEDLKQLSIKYGLDYEYLRKKVKRDAWKEFKVTVSSKVSQKVAEKIENKVDSFLNVLEKKGIYYEKLVEASQAQASRNNEGIPELEPPDLVKYATVEGMAIEWRKLALGITDKVQVSGEVNVNVVAILEKLRGMERKPIDIESEEAELSSCKLIEG